ncbi:M23 family metallopeptidase [Marivivens aquimaris]|uniref:M23 family metallopeptidase n=1 Tax=Marivivens aquimaris TaxID=2774876 RepID=UPI00187E8238|nr:M23 family metallopeptidase [Marivivens aquimaris]
MRVTSFGPLLLSGCAILALTACNEPLDFDMRDLGGKSSAFDTSSAARNIGARPEPDANGLISYPTYQVAVAQRGDTVQQVADRLGIDAVALATYNGVTPATVMRRDELLAIPSSQTVRAGASAGASTAIAGDSVDVTTLAASAIDRAGPQTVTPTTQPSGMPAAAPDVVAPSDEPIRHQVQRGETAYSIARLYNVPVRAIAEWNSLDSNLSVREGQFLLVPQGDDIPATPAAVEEPGAGSATPVPPSASAPLPEESPIATAPAASAPAPVESPDLGNTSTQANSDAPLLMPVRGTIVRTFSAGTNEGIDIQSTAGAEVVAAAAGTIAAISKDTSGNAVVVVRHATDLLTVYTNLDNLAITEKQDVSKGQKLGEVRSNDTPVVHFEVRLSGMKAANPEDYLP